MPKLTTYNDIQIEVHRATEDPAELVYHAARQTMLRDLEETKFAGRSLKSNFAPIIKYLVKAKHKSPLEHAKFTFRVVGCSRSLLAQLTRQRAFAFTSSSQHYQDYRDYPVVVSPKLLEAGQEANLNLNHLAFESAYNSYTALIKGGLPVEEARQVLPNAAAVNLFVTADARNLFDFLNVRICDRNVDEMVIASKKIKAAAKEWFPELFSFAYPDCVLDKCYQGKMCCGKKLNLEETEARAIWLGKC